MPTRGRRTSHDLKIDRRPPIPRILIVCEGERTEPDYFLQFRVTKPVDVRGEAMNTLSLVERTIFIRNNTEGPFDQVWCVFDLDSFPKQNFEEAIRLAQKEKIRVAYSNEAFELWYVLHFDYLQSQVDRKQYITILGEKLGRHYKKNDRTIHDAILPRQANAIANAKRLLEEHHPQYLPPSEKKPSTTVYELVLELNKYAR